MVLSFLKCVQELLPIIALSVASSWSNDFLYHDYCIIGAGPSGLQMAYFLQHAGRNYVVFERRNTPGHFFTLYPRHRKLISINKRYTGKSNSEFNLRHDWNSLLSHNNQLLFRHYSQDFFPDADTMVHYLADFASKLALHVHYNTSIVLVMLEKDPKAWNGHYFILRDQNTKNYKCSVLLVATGMWVPHEVNFPGSEYVEGYESVSINPNDFAGQSVLILGRGNSAFETAENILGVTNFVHMVGRSRVRLSWATHYVGDLRSVGLMHGKGSKKKYPLIKPSYEAKATRGLFLLGTASHSVDFRKSAGGFIHGFRYTARAVHRLLEVRHHKVPWPASNYPVVQLTNAIVRRVNEASGLYQMFSVLADIILLKENATKFEYLEEYPVGVLQDLEWRTGRKVQNGLFVIIMEYGKNFSGPDKDVFYYNRAVGEPEHAWQSNFLHPVIYYYKQLPTEREMRLCPPDWPLPRPDAIHHIVEDFLTDWTAPNAHVLPLRRFLENCLETDLRRFYAESCFLFAFTHLRLPPFCQQGYVRKQGLVGSEKLQHHRVAAELIEHAAMNSQDERESGAMQSHNQLLKSGKIPSHQLQHLTGTKDEL
ncbi:FAD-dependent oxidoreductase domain-containing protein 2 isoform X3 [Ahaetulla prasina]|uniref:FAD-dependent oxidoreductase domain-containing protein 2 isoform X3 n=1 Tax=Ahaetulla prasina TaxID=499056 RepID=UPI002647C9E7|nr:FAD-dependent oxidoreductase domain-containing protein 2 isoform X3 [Ahaetulla prasina]